MDYTTTYNVSDPQVCYNTTNSYPNYSYTTVTNLPNDGVVLSESAMAFPGTDHSTRILMLGSNHQQMRNDSNTRDVLKRAFDGQILPYLALF